MKILLLLLMMTSAHANYVHKDSFNKVFNIGDKVEFINEIHDVARGSTGTVLDNTKYYILIGFDDNSQIKIGQAVETFFIVNVSDL